MWFFSDSFISQNSKFKRFSESEDSLTSCLRFFIGKICVCVEIFPSKGRRKKTESFFFLRCAFFRFCFAFVYKICESFGNYIVNLADDFWYETPVSSSRSSNQIDYYKEIKFVVNIFVAPCSFAFINRACWMLTDLPFHSFSVNCWLLRCAVRRCCLRLQVRTLLLL